MRIITLDVTAVLRQGQVSQCDVDLWVSKLLAVIGAWRIFYYEVIRFGLLGTYTQNAAAEHRTHSPTPSVWIMTDTVCVVLTILPRISETVLFLLSSIKPPPPPPRHRQLVGVWGKREEAVELEDGIGGKGGCCRGEGDGWTEGWDILEMDWWCPFNILGRPPSTWEERLSRNVLTCPRPFDVRGISSLAMSLSIPPGDPSSASLVAGRALPSPDPPLWRKQLEAGDKYLTHWETKYLSVRWCLLVGGSVTQSVFFGRVNSKGEKQTHQLRKLNILV